MASISLYVERSVNEDGTYTLEAAVASATGMPREVFVFMAGTDTYDHVATAADMFNVPTIKVPTSAFVRQFALVLNFTSLKDATDAQKLIPARVKKLVEDYSAVAGSYVGHETYDFSA